MSSQLDELRRSFPPGRGEELRIKPPKMETCYSKIALSDTTAVTFPLYRDRLHPGERSPSEARKPQRTEGEQRERTTSEQRERSVSEARETLGNAKVILP